MATKIHKMKETIMTKWEESDDNRKRKYKWKNTTSKITTYHHQKTATTRWWSSIIIINFITKRSTVEMVNEFDFQINPFFRCIGCMKIHLDTSNTFRFIWEHVVPLPCPSCSSTFFFDLFWIGSSEKWLFLDYTRTSTDLPSTSFSFTFPLSFFSPSGLFSVSLHTVYTFHFQFLFWWWIWGMKSTKIYPTFKL